MNVRRTHPVPCVAVAGDLSILGGAAILAAVTVGSTVQSTIGFGFAMVAAPVVALIRPAALPSTLLLLALPMTGAMAIRERRDIDLGGYLRIVAGRILGTAGGVWLLVSVPQDSLAALFGGMILVAAVASAVRGAVELRWRPRFTAGIASGVMGTTTSIGGPPLALLYQDRPGPEIRSTLALSFFTGLVASLTGLAIAGRILGWHLLLALELLPALALGVVVGGGAGRRLDAGWLRPAVIAFSAASGGLALVKGLLA